MADIMFPPGRMVGGSLDELFQDKENGKPKFDAAGKPVMKCRIGYAILKGSEKHWAETAWGQQIWAVGQGAYPALVRTPSFSWKITDGDSDIPNKNNKAPRDKDGYPGHWVLWFQQSWLPKKYNSDGTVEITAEGAIVPGYYIQMYGSVSPNKIAQGQTPGVYLNPSAVALVGEGDRIVGSDIDATTLGFGQAALPAGARPVTPVAPGFAAAAPAPSTPAAPASVPAPAPRPEFLAVPSAPPAPPVGPRMTAKAAGATYEAFKAQGWTDEQLRANGYME